MIAGGQIIMLTRWLVIACAAVGLSACAKAQLNHNTVELATSVADLIDEQVFYNLSKALFEGPGFIPAQVQIGAGTATTTNTISPSLSLPLGATVATPATAGNATTYSFAPPGLTLGLTNTGTQTWNTSPINDAGQFSRLRALYNFATGRIPEGDFTCQYPVQSLALPLVGNGGNAFWDCAGSRVFGDPNFLRGHTCVVCATGPLKKDVAATVTHNPKLIYNLVSDQVDDAHNFKIGSYMGKGLYVCRFCETHPERDGKVAFSNLTIFIYEAMLASTGGAKEDAPPGATGAASGGGGNSTGSGKSSTISPFFYAIPLR